MKIINKEYYRSKPVVNMTDDLVRITITAKRRELRELEKFIKERPNTQLKIDGLKCTCAQGELQSSWYCPKHGFKYNPPTT